MLACLRTCLLGATLLSAAPSAAQDKPKEDDSSEIVVTGNRGMEEELRDFVGALTPGPGTGRIARFERSICPLAVGVTPAQKQAIASRIRRIAQEVGLDVGSDRCVPNVLVVVTRDKKAFIEALLKKQDYYFGDMSNSEVRRIAAEPGPAAAWQLKTIVSQDGIELFEEGETPVNRTSARASRITSAVRPAFTAAAVIVESNALEGLTTTELADYAAMRILAQTDPSRLAASNAPSILKIFDIPVGEPVPLTLTEWDLGFLKARYSAPQNLRAAAERSAIRRQMGKELEGQQPKDE